MDQTYLDKVEQRMYPGKCSDIGFLLPGQKLTEIIEQDNLTLQQLGITHKQITDKLLTITEKDRTLGIISSKSGDTIIENRYIVSGEKYYGHQQCPFKDKDHNCGEPSGSVDYIITNIETKEKITFPQLIIHLISQHQFFEGTQYRLDPQKVVEFFNLQANINYAPIFIKETIWTSHASSSQICHGDVKFANQFCKKIYPVTEDVLIFHMEDYDIKNYKPEDEKDKLDMFRCIRSDPTGLLFILINEPLKQKPEPIIIDNYTLELGEQKYKGVSFMRKYERQIVLLDNDKDNILEYNTVMSPKSTII